MELHKVEDSHFLRCDATLFGDWLLMFWSTIMPSTSTVSNGQLCFLYCLPKNMKTLGSFELLGTSHPIKWHDIRN